MSKKVFMYFVYYIFDNEFRKIEVKIRGKEYVLVKIIGKLVRGGFFK